MQQMVGPYKILKQLPGTGVGMTYQAVLPSQPEQLLVVKVLDAHNIDPGFYALFQREIQLLALLDSIPIVPVNDVSINDKFIYIVMPYFSGGSLETRLQKENFSKNEWGAVIQRLAVCLEQAHNIGIIHGDIKPSNILFDDEGHSYLSDFGMIKFAKAQTKKRTNNILLGPPAYVSPEQILLSDNIDNRSDIYSLASIAFYLLYKQTPFTSNTALGFAVKQVSAQPCWHSGISDDIREFFDKGFAKSPDDRFPTAIELYAGFAHLLDTHNDLPLLEQQMPDIVLPAQINQQIEPLPDVVQSSRFRWVFASALMLLAVLAGIASFYFSNTFNAKKLQQATDSNNANNQLMVIDTSVTSTQTPRRTIPLTSLSTTSAVLSNVISTTPSEVGMTVPTSTSTPPHVITPISSPPTPVPIPVSDILFSGITATPESQTYEIKYNDTIFTVASLLNVDMSYFMGLNNLTCNSHLYPGKELLIPPPGILAYSLPNINLSAESDTQYEYLRTLECMTEVDAVAFSPDGRYLAIARNNAIFLWRVQDWKPVMKIKGHQSTISALEFSPDGQILASGSADRSILLWNINTGEEILSIAAHAAEITDVAFAPDGKTLASSSTDQTFKIWSVKDGSNLHESRGYKTYSVAYSNHGDFLAVGYGDSVSLYDTTDYALLGKFSSHHTVKNLIFSTNDTLLAASSGMWFIPDGFTIYDWGNSPHQVKFTPDGRNIIVGRDVRSLRNGKIVGSLELPIDETEQTAYERDNVDFSSDGRLLVLGNQDGTFIYVGVPGKQEEGTKKQTSYTVQPGENFYTIAEQFRVPLTDLLKVNGLDCMHVPYPGQMLDIPLTSQTDAPKSLTPISSDTIQHSTLTNIDPLCSGQWGGLDFLSNDTGISSGPNLWRLPGGSLLIRGHDPEIPGENALSNQQVAEKSATSPDGKLFATVADHDIQIWDTSTGKQITMLTGHSGTVISVVFSPDSQMLASSSDDKSIRVWNVKTGETTVYFNGYTAQSLFYMPGGDMLVSRAGDTARIWDLNNQEIFQTIKGIEKYLVSERTGNYLAYIGCEEKSGSRCLQNVVNLYRVNDGVVEHTFYGMTELVQAIEFSPDGQTLAIASGQNIVLWDIYTREITLRIRINDYVDEHVNIMRFSPDGTLLATVVDNTEIRFWSVHVEQSDLRHRINLVNIRDISFSNSGNWFGILSDNGISVIVASP